MTKPKPQFVLVPREPTLEMIRAYRKALGAFARTLSPKARSVISGKISEDDKAKLRYAAMLASAPAVPPPASTPDIVREWERLSTMDETLWEDIDAWAKSVMAMLAEQAASIEDWRGRLATQCGKTLAAESTSRAAGARAGELEAATIERCAKIADAFADENRVMAGDTILLDPVLRHEGFTAENMERSEDLQTKGTIHSSMFHAAQNIAKALRALTTQQDRGDTGK